MQHPIIKLDEEGATVFASESTALRTNGMLMADNSISVSSVENCKRYFFAELPPGTKTNFAPATRLQLCVCLTGCLELFLPDKNSLKLTAGSVWKTENTTGDGHAYTVTGDEPATVLIVQLD